jgi:hypothetical protein
MLFGLGTAIIAVQLFIDNLIVRDVCRRENRKFSPLWLYNPYWQGRMFSLSWFEEARKTGLFVHRAAAFAAFIIYLLMTAVTVFGSRELATG